jgi:hypothetical protein
MGHPVKAWTDADTLRVRAARAAKAPVVRKTREQQLAYLRAWYRRNRDKLLAQQKAARKARAAQTRRKRSRASTAMLLAEREALVCRVRALADQDLARRRAAESGQLL